MTLATPKYTPLANTYLAGFTALQNAQSSNGAAAWLAPARERAWARFSELGFPTARRGNERWKYTNLAPLAQVAFNLAEPPGVMPALDQVRSVAPWDDAWTTLVFIDGRFSKKLSRPGTPDAVAVDLATAASARRDVVEAHLTRIAALDEEHFTLLNTAFQTDGGFIHIPDGATPPQPIHLLFVSTAQSAPSVTHPRTLIVAGKHSEATIIECFVSVGGGGNLRNAVVDDQLDEGARVSHYRMLMEDETSFHIGNTRVRQLANSCFNCISVATGQAIGRNDIHVLIDGEGAECNLTGLYLTAGRQHLDNNISVTHAKPHGTSHQYYKGILAGQSHAVFSGIVVVKPGAIKTYADQRDLNLLLSHGAEIDTKPSLEIFADDVKCYHGATAGHVDLDTLYYMRSRGIDLETATAMLVRGFAADIVERVTLPALTRYVQDVTDRLLPSLIAEEQR